MRLYHGTTIGEEITGFADDTRQNLQSSAQKKARALQALQTLEGLVNLNAATRRLYMQTENAVTLFIINLDCQFGRCKSTGRIANALRWTASVKTRNSYIPWLSASRGGRSQTHRFAALPEGILRGRRLRSISSFKEFAELQNFLKTREENIAHPLVCPEASKSSKRGFPLGAAATSASNCLRFTFNHCQPAQGYFYNSL